MLSPGPRCPRHQAHSRAAADSMISAAGWFALPIDLSGPSPPASTMWQQGCQSEPAARSRCAREPRSGVLVQRGWPEPSAFLEAPLVITAAAPEVGGSDLPSVDRTTSLPAGSAQRSGSGGIADGLLTGNVGDERGNTR